MIVPLSSSGKKKGKEDLWIKKDDLIILDCVGMCMLILKLSTLILGIAISFILELVEINIKFLIELYFNRVIRPKAAPYKNC